MFSILALTCWIGGLLLITVQPWIGACVAAGGFVFAGQAIRRPDDMELMFGLAFGLVILVSLVRVLAWGWSVLT